MGDTVITRSFISLLPIIRGVGKLHQIYGQDRCFSTGLQQTVSPLHLSWPASVRRTSLHPHNNKLCRVHSRTRLQRNPVASHKPFYVATRTPRA